MGGGRGEVQGICVSGAQAQWLWALAVVAGGRAVADWVRAADACAAVRWRGRRRRRRWRLGSGEGVRGVGV